MIKISNNIQRMLEKQAEGPGQSIDQARRPVFEGMTPEEWRRRTPFAEWSALDPQPRIRMEWSHSPDSWRALEAARNSPGFQSPGFVQEPPTTMSRMLPAYNLFSGLQDSIQEAVQRNPYNMNRALSNLDRGYNAMVGPYDSIP